LGTPLAHGKKKMNWDHHLTGNDNFAVCPNGKAYEQRLKLYHVLVVMHTAKMYNLPCVLLLTCVFYFSTWQTCTIFAVYFFLHMFST